MQELKFEHTQAVLEEYKQLVEAKYIDELLRHEHKATFQLIDSVRTTFNFGVDTIAVDIDLATYWKYIEWDTKPHWAPIAPLITWATAKRLPEPKRIAHAVQRKIAFEGTTGTHDLQNSVQAVNQLFYDKIVDAVVQDFADATDVIIHTFART